MLHFPANSASLSPLALVAACAITFVYVMFVLSHSQFCSHQTSAKDTHHREHDCNNILIHTRLKYPSTNVVQKKLEEEAKQQ